MMPSATLNLTHIQYTQLTPTTWCATAQVGDMIHNQRQQQRKGVRLLLQQLLGQLKINDTLDESAFPYRLIDNQYYVCFSHTGAKNKDVINNNVINNNVLDNNVLDNNILDNNDIKNNAGQAVRQPLVNTVAVIMSHDYPVGIDIENNDVTWHVAQRFYSANEIAAIQALPMTQRPIVTKLLWQIKESFIKIRQHKLTQGLGVDYSYLIAALLNAIKEPSPFIIIADVRSHYHIAVLPSQQTIAIF